MSDLDLSLIPTDEIRSALCETVENYLKTKKYKISVKSASQAGESNFVGVVYRVTFCSEDGDLNDAKFSKLILKVAPQNEARRTQFKSRSLFLREMYMYNVVIYFIFINFSILFRVSVSIDSFERCCHISEISSKQKV